ncbi:uncharacterized protein C11orf16 homolog isoform X2 [Fukomys damarensis]|uniref:uncharacterized protein C11orf16 homolog isoform X2 n=1 Tax=Fukomys damarensis TaxID=885580 RepID=UPI0005400227|nr:uncharacterized protein C11orf16 homolog isoform X2 [Fukomys damarensis]
MIPKGHWMSVEQVLSFSEGLTILLWPAMPLPKYCSVATTLQAPGWGYAALRGDLSFACPFAHRAPGLPTSHAFTRYSSYHPSLHIADPAWQGPGWLGRVRDAANTWVLARREPDGFYYQAQIKAAPELESQGVLLVEFESALTTSPKLPGQRQSVVPEEDVVQLSPFVEYSLRPGDKVLAAWEPGGQQYGPGTVLLGSEMRGIQQASKEAEVTVHFWNGKTAQVPLGGVRWVPPTVWKKAVERLSKPGASEHPSALLCAPCCTLLGTVSGGIANRLPSDTVFLCPPCHPHACCQLLCQGYCCPLMGPTWWPLTRTSDVTARELPESELKPAAQLLPLEGPKEEAGAVHALPVVSSSSSSSSCEEDLEANLEVGLPQRQMADSAVNTDPLLPERPLMQSGPRQPEWRYWRRNGPEPRPGKPGIKCHNIQKEDDNKQEIQTAVVGTPKELALKATKKPLKTLLLGAEYRKMGPGIIRWAAGRQLQELVDLSRQSWPRAR